MNFLVLLVMKVLLVKVNVFLEVGEGFYFVLFQEKDFEFERGENFNLRGFFFVIWQ